MHHCGVHAESVLMVLARIMYNGGSAAMDSLESDVRVDTLFPVDGHVIIGASTESCWCCDILRTCLGIYKPVSGRLASLVLPGTHGIITPWFPSQGIPECILLHIRRRLFEVLHKRICGDHPDFPVVLPRRSPFPSLEDDSE
ncbi:hypothetical protein FKP32DRAFT_1455747 [Trametes sanguinea]|nr:hypothetical protein FKP32DRAFT_1455747 [Trametes sanguinea]